MRSTWCGVLPTARCTPHSDLCPHRGARLSQGWLTGDRLVCGYHGWQYDADGRCVCIPQNDPSTPIPRRARLQPVHADERYEMVWICIAEEPRAPIPEICPS